MTTLFLMLAMIGQSNQPNLSCTVVDTFVYKGHKHLAMRINMRCKSKEITRVDIVNKPVRFGDKVCKFIENEDGLFFVCLRGGKEISQVAIPDCKYDEQDLHSIMVESPDYKHIFQVKCFGDIEV